MEKFKLFRCMFLKEKKDYIVGKDIFNNKVYYIKKSKETRKFKVGRDNSFYAISETEGTIFKKTILKVIDYDKVVM